MAESGLRAKGTLARMRDKAAEGVGHVVSTMEAGAAAFAFGWARGRYAKDGELRVMGVPVDLASGLAMKALAFGEQFGGYDKDAHALGQGALDAYLTSMGVRFGVEARDKAEGKTTTTAGGLTPEELAREIARSTGAAA